MAKTIPSDKAELLCKPFGPYKLARIICRALEHRKSKPRAAQLGVNGQQGDCSTPSSQSVASGQASAAGGAAALPNLHIETIGNVTIQTTSGLHTLSSRPAGPRTAIHVRDVSSGQDGGFPFPEQGPMPSAAPTSPMPIMTGSEMASTDQPSTSTSRKPRLLLVDDNKVNLQLLHTFISKKGHAANVVHLAEDGAQAVAAFKSQLAAGTPPDIIFMDISMPVMDGYEATQLIRELESRDVAWTEQGGFAAKRRALIVALTGNAGANDQSAAFGCGVDIYMTKPVSLREVGKLLAQWRE